MPVVNPGIRRQVAGAITRLFNSAAFALPLTHTAVPTRAAPGTTGTFTRATTETGQKYDEAGYLDFTALAGEMVFKGARRVRNLLTFTEDIGNAAWTKRETTYSGGRLIETATTADHSVWQAASTTTGSYYVASGHAKADQNSVIQITFSSGQVSGDPKANFNLSTGALGTVDAGLTAEIEAAPDIGAGYYRFSVKAQAASTSLTAFFAMVPLPTSVRLANYAGNVSNGLYLNKMQIEDVTGQTTQTASEYVSVGVESAPYYHGSFVDGVKCFPNDLSGNPIPSTTMLGYVAEGARTNVLIRSNTISSWSLSGTPSVTQNAIGPDGGTTGWTITDDDGAFTEFPYLSSTLTAATYTVSAFVKKTVGAQSNYPVLAVDNGANMAIATVDTTNGVITSWSAYTGRTINTLSSTITSFNDDYWRASITFTGTAAAWNTYLIPACTSSATFAGPAFDATVTGSAVFYGAQVELGSFASSYIATTTVAVTRDADVLTYSSAGNISDTAGWAYAEYSSNVIDGNYGVALSGTGVGAGRIICHYSATNCAINDATTELQKTGLAAINTGMRKRVATWAATPAMAVTGDGLAPATMASYDGTIAPTAIAIGYRGITNIEHIFGNIGPIYIGQRQLSASEMQAITA